MKVYFISTDLGFRTEVRRLVLLFGDISLAPLACPTPSLGRGSSSLTSRCGLCSPIRGLGLGGPVVGHLESRCSSSRSSSRGGSRCRGTISRPVGHWGSSSSKLFTSPLLLGRRGNVVSLLAGNHLLSPGCLLLLGLLRVAVEEEIGHNLPGHVTRDGSTQPQDPM